MAKKENIWSGILRNGLIIFVLCCIVWFIGRGRSGSSHKAPSQAAKTTLRIATDYTPDNFIVQDSGTFGGRQVELAALLFPDTTITWSLAKSRAETLEDLRKGAIDLYAASIPLSSADSVGTVLVSHPLYTSAYALLCEEGADWLKDFTGHRAVSVYLSTEDEAAMIVAQNIKELAYPEITPVLLPDSPMKLALRVARKELKYAIVDRALAEAVDEKSPNTQVVHNLFFETNQVWLVSPSSPELLDTLNHRITRLQGSEEWKYITEQTQRH